MYILKRVGESTEPWGSPIRCNLQQLFLPFSSTIKRRFDNIVMTNFISFTSSVRSKSFCSRLLWFTVSYAAVRSINAAPVTVPSSKPSSICRVRLTFVYSMTFLVRIQPVGLLASALLLALSVLVTSVQAVCTLCTGGLLGDNSSGCWDLCWVLGEL